MPLPDPLTDPVPLAVLTLLVFGVVQYQRTLTWTEYRGLHALKRRYFPVLDRLWPHAVHTKQRPKDDAEYLLTREQSVKSVWQQLVSEGGSPHLVSSLKQRPGMDDGAVEYSAAHVLWRHDGSQTEAYLFANDDGTVDVYAHFEPSVLRPTEHLSGEQTDGDPKGVVRDALGVPIDASGA